MILTGGEYLEFVVILLGKGMAWLLLCGLVGRIARRSLPSRKLTITTLLLLSAASFLPALWTWDWNGSTALEETETARPFQTLAIPTGKPPGATADFPATPINAPGQFLTTSRPWQDWVLFAWLGGTAGLAVWLAAGFLTARRWVRHATPLTDPGWKEILTTECGRQGLRRRPALLFGSHIPGPCIAGFWRPFLLLPASCREWDRETSRIVIRHELAHIKNRDFRHGWIRALTLILHWPNPLVWAAIGGSRRDEELQADAAVLALGTTPGQYAATLLSVARSCQFTTRSPLLTAMAHSSTLEFRIRQLLAGKSAPQSPVRYAAAGLGATVLAALLIGCGAVQKNAGESGGTFLSGARTPMTPIDSQQLSALVGAPPSKATKYKLNVRVIGQNGEKLAGPGLLNGKPDDFRPFPPSITVRSGQKGTLEMIREFPHPTAFDLPQWPAADGTRKPTDRSGAAPMLPNGGSFPVTPVTPREFSFRNIGWKLEGLTVKPQGGFLVVSGTFHETTFDGFIQNAGEAYSPIITSGTNAFGRKEEIVLSDNKVLSPTFTSRETPFQAAALPGKAYRFRLNLKQPNAFLEVTCSPEE